MLKGTIQKRTRGCTVLSSPTHFGSILSVIRRRGHSYCINPFGSHGFIHLDRMLESFHSPRPRFIASQLLFSSSFMNYHKLLDLPFVALHSRAYFPLPVWATSLPLPCDRPREVPHVPLPTHSHIRQFKFIPWIQFPFQTLSDHPRPLSPVDICPEERRDCWDRFLGTATLGPICPRHVSSTCNVIRVILSKHHR